MTESILELQDIHRHFIQGDKDLHILRGVNFTLKKSEVVTLVGASGSGKSTLLQIAGLLDHASSGEVVIDGAACGKLSDRKRTRIRRHDVGFIYQFHHLLPEFNALENVMLPQIVAGLSKSEAAKHAEALLTKLGLGARVDHRPSELSGGEQQRVAIARALINKPKILLADEPTGNLDEMTGNGVMNELLRLSREEGISALVATHNKDLARKMDRCVTLHNGLLE
ncbi:ABC transporter ATP-binding protein [Paremcibacter congregatus]|uniref:ABC transporter n=1 Tax=Paremcibacter congregatus TaxID=2043170 RepID=A0A2G4YSQ4_9PROT|nr:ABC transporter ATP-binding protein [Paremcibacter congregatus]PHZ85333.1 ABC transporter [Paremcibacter congregatus]QDE27736.1 ABC transporter ATP-binding protein [Paremcibacter congregatus]|tara:strand:- start:9453 stop:10127 length:675 start_codon:yes stop_codon:yes gene_type:complete